MICEDFEQGLGNKNILHDITSSNSTILFGNFNCPYHPYLNLEVCSINDVKPSIKLEKKFESIRCVVQNEATEGIKNSQVVAIFPENFKGRVVQANDPVFYFVNKFSERHFKHTRPFIANSRLKDFFADVTKTDESKTFELIANWVHIHELSHRKGPMPIPQYLKEKSGKFSAAMEELRADLGVIQYCLINNSDEARLTSLYVLCERLLAYPLFRDRNNFDAISSVFLWKYFEESEFFESPSFDQLSNCVNSLINKIHTMEIAALEFDSILDRKKFLNESVSAYLGNIDQKFNDYHKYWESL
jgi:hypothetical protein